MRGEEIKMITNKFFESGSYEIMVDAQNMASGVYFHKMEAGGFVAIKKLIILR